MKNKVSTDESFSDYPSGGLYVIRKQIYLIEYDLDSLDTHVKWPGYYRTNIKSGKVTYIQGFDLVSEIKRKAAHKLTPQVKKQTLIF